MNTAECAEQVMKWVDENVIHVHHKTYKAKLDEESRQRNERTWERDNPEDGVGSFSTNPYRSTGHEKQNIEILKKQLQDALDIQEFVRQRIVAGLL
jgi:hypothetical protein